MSSGTGDPATGWTASSSALWSSPLAPHPRGVVRYLWRAPPVFWIGGCPSCLPTVEGVTTMAHDHSEHRTLAMSSDWIQTLVFRHEIIQQYVVPSPTWEMSLNDCLIASALLDKITENIPVKD